MAFVLLPVTWGALPLAGFAPTFYQAYLPPMVYQNLFNAQAIFAFGFKSILVIHAFELLYAGYKCVKLGLTSAT
eukprot:03048.XXX_124058_124365_1 [CDS] Oithona nana genome sequencing.